MSAQRLAFLELKKRLTVLELQHNTLTSICTVLAKQIKELRLQPQSNHEELNKSEIDMITTNKKSVEQLFKERLQSRVQKTEIREIDLNKNKLKSNKKTKKQPVPDLVEEIEESEESEDDSGSEESNDSEETEEIEVTQVKPVESQEQKAKQSAKNVLKKAKPVAKISESKKAPVKRATKVAQIKNSNIAVEIVDSMSK
jgi:hypothetical protein